MLTPEAQLQASRDERRTRMLRRDDVRGSRSRRPLRDDRSHKCDCASVAPLKHVRTCALPILIVAFPHSRQGQGNFY